MREATRDNQGCDVGEAGHYVACVDPSTHINFVSKWHPTTDLATEYAEKVQEELLKYLIFQ